MGERPFGDDLGALCAKAMARAKGNPELLGEMIERQIGSLAFTIAMAGKGDAETIGKMLSGAETHLNEQAAGFAKIAKMLAGRP